MNVYKITETPTTITIGWDFVDGQEGFIPTIDGSQTLTDNKRHASSSKTQNWVRIGRPGDGMPHEYGVVILGSIASGAITDPPSLVGKLSWAPPSLSSPIVKQVTNTSSRFVAPSPGLDLLLDFKEVLRERILTLQGWRNVVGLGCEMVNDQNSSAQVAVFACTGRVHLEGFKLSGKGVIDACVGLSTGGPPYQGADVVLQNFSCETHFVCVQLWDVGNNPWQYGGVRNLLIDRFSGRSEYQGIFLGNHDGPFGGGDFRNVQLDGSSASSEHLLWKTYRTDKWGNTSRVSLSNFWLRQLAGAYGTDARKWVMPDASGFYTAPADPTRAAIAGSDAVGNFVSWVAGADMLGKAHIGDGASYEAGAKAGGLGYVTPGYVA